MRFFHGSRRPAGESPVVLATTALVPGGVWRHIVDLAEALRGSGYTPVVGLLADAHELRSSAVIHDLQVTDLIETVFWSECVWHAHLHNTYDHILGMSLAARRLGGASVLTEHLPRTNASDETLLPGPRRAGARRLKTAFKRFEFAGTDAVIAVSSSSADFLSERYGLPRDRIDVIANGIASTEAGSPVVPTESGSRSSPMQVVSVGSVTTQKGHETLLEAAALSGGGWRVRILGEGPLRTKLSHRAAAHELPVRFDGWTDEVDQAIASADVACMPSRWESCPYAALEAMQAGLPLVGSDVDGLRDLIEPGVNGVLVPPGDAAGFARALDCLAANPDLRGRMGVAARASADAHTLDRMVRDTTAVYRRLTA